MDDFTIDDDWESPVDSPETDSPKSSENPESPESPESPKSSEETADSGSPEDVGQAVEEPQATDSSQAIDWEAEAQNFKEKYLRALADNENSRRWQEKEVANARKYSSEPILRELINVLENLHLALGYANFEDPSVKALAEGVSLTIKDCLTKMGDFGFKEIKAAPGEPFDYNFQEAIGQEPNPDLPNGTVAQMVSRGYLFYDRLLRPARVILVKNEAPSEES
jgi:molecular chaperone GrpE